MSHYTNDALLARYFELVAKGAPHSHVAPVRDELDRRGL